MNALESPKAAAVRNPGHGSGGGFLLGLTAYALWGVLPVYFKALRSVAAVDIVAHRVLWSLPFLAILITATRGWGKMRAAANRPRTLGILLLTAFLIGFNWLLYVYAVTSGHILAASFGYYLNPLANVLLGRFVLGEKLNRLQWTAVAIAAAGICVLAAGALSQLWLSLALCISFAFYGLLRKIVPADALTGLAIETTILFPLAARLARLARAGVAAGARRQLARHDPSAAHRRRLDHAAPPLHRRREAPRLIRRSACCNSWPYIAVPDRGAALRREVHNRPCSRFSGDMGRPDALRDGNAARAEAAAAARTMIEERRCSTSSR